MSKKDFSSPLLRSTFHIGVNYFHLLQDWTLVNTSIHIIFSSSMTEQARFVSILGSYYNERKVLSLSLHWLFNCLSFPRILKTTKKMMSEKRRDR